MSADVTGFRFDDYLVLASLHNLVEHDPVNGYGALDPELKADCCIEQSIINSSHP